MSIKPDFSRRNFLKATGIVAGAAAFGGSVIAATAVGAQAADAPTTDAKADAKPEMAHAAVKENIAFRGRMFFTNDLQFSTLSAAAERIFPKDETGPGAIELFVPFFIDNQLAGAFGYNAREYISGPFSSGAPTQGYQTPLLRRDIFIQGLAALNTQSNATFKKDFPTLGDAEKDQILKMCEAGKIPTEGFTSAEFFALLKTAVLAGAYADPIYSGNNTMNGWKMKDYPGAQMSYIAIIESREFERIAPLSLANM